MKHPIDKQCPKCKAWMLQTSGYVKDGKSHGTSWECPRCGHEEDDF